MAEFIDSKRRALSISAGLALFAAVPVPTFSADKSEDKEKTVGATEDPGGASLLPLLMGKDSRCNRESGDINSLLNYGYAVLPPPYAPLPVPACIHPSPFITRAAAKPCVWPTI